MAKIYGLFGSMTGKVADVVMSVRNGEQIARKYQPVVSNPSTTKQVESRAKLKLASQLSAVFAPVIAMPRQGAVSPRNLFVKENYGAISYADNQAEATLTSIKLTKSVVSLYVLDVTRSGSNLNYGLATQFSTDLDRVVYCFFSKQSDNTLRFMRSVVVNTPGTNNTFGGTLELESAGLTVVVYAYGIRDNNDAAKAIFGNMQVVNAETIAKLVVTRTLRESDITLTETRAVESVPVSPNMSASNNEDDENR